jgi:hypothetical protein
MKRMNLSLYDWVFEPPRETLQAGVLDSLPRISFAVVFVSSLFSYALAKTLMASALVDPSRTIPFLGELVLNLLLPALAFFGILTIIYEIVRLVWAEPMPFRPWLTAGIAALVPLHLTLPLALVCRPMGTGGLMIYTLVEAVICLAVIRRWAWGIQTICNWPLWGAYLLVLSPVIMGSAVILVMTAFMMSFGMLALLAALS